MAYTDKGRVQRYLNVDIDSSYDTQVDDWIAEVKKFIDDYCGKTFEAVTETRYYDGNGRNCIIVDDFVDTTITELLILNTSGGTESTLTEGHSNDFITYPQNTDTKHELRLTVSAARSVFPSRSNAVKLTADFGYSASVPETIRNVATQLVARIVEKGLKGGKVAGIQLGDYQVTLEKIDEHAEALGIYKTLDLYRDISI